MIVVEISTTSNDVGYSGVLAEFRRSIWIQLVNMVMCNMNITKELMVWLYLFFLNLDFFLLLNPCTKLICATTHNSINGLLSDGYEVYDDVLPAPKTKPSPTGDNDWPKYKEGCKQSGIDHRRESVFRWDAAKFYGINKECISILT